MRCWLYWPQIFLVCHIHGSDFCFWAKAYFPLWCLFKEKEKEQQLLEAVLLPSFFVSVSPCYFLLLVEYPLYVSWKCAKDKIVSPVLRKRCCLDRFPPWFILPSHVWCRGWVNSQKPHHYYYYYLHVIVPSYFIFLFPALSADLIDCLFLSHICVFIPVSVAASFLALLHGSPYSSITASIPPSTAFGLSPLRSILHTTKSMALQKSWWCLMGRISPNRPPQDSFIIFMWHTKSLLISLFTTFCSFYTIKPDTAVVDICGFLKLPALARMCTNVHSILIGTQLLHIPLSVASCRVSRQTPFIPQSWFPSLHIHRLTDIVQL